MRARVRPGGGAHPGDAGEDLLDEARIDVQLLGGRGERKEEQPQEGRDSTRSHRTPGLPSGLGPGGGASGGPVGTGAICVRQGGRQQHLCPPKRHGRPSSC